MTVQGRDRVIPNDGKLWSEMDKLDLGAKLGDWRWITSPRDEISTRV